jgi:UDP-glucuronate 4-epimerase
MRMGLRGALMTEVIAERKTFFVTGCAGFIGYHLCLRLLQDGSVVVGIDNMNAYYDVELKRDRLDQLRGYKDFSFQLLDIADARGLHGVFARNRFDVVINLAAQAGVRYSLNHPEAYIQSNVVGFANLVQECRISQVSHFVYASSSSVYGANEHLPLSVENPVDHPISLYAATKRADELIAHAYSYLFSLPTTGLRFFTVYGPWGRPDMALFLFTDAIFRGRPLTLFNGGEMYRDFTYVDDAIEAVTRLIPLVPKQSVQPALLDLPSSSTAAFRVYNIGHGFPVRVGDCVDLIEECLGKKAIRVSAPIQPGDVVSTHADTQSLRNDTGFSPSIPIEVGIPRFVKSYLDYYGQRR